MAFKNLEERFNKNVDKLYAGAKNKFDGGKPSKGNNDDPLIVRNPGDGYWNLMESRSTPVASTSVDLKRLTLFTLSKRGIQFLAKQQILQTGNTFETTRIINPAFVISNAVPFIHTKRALDVPTTVRGIGRQLLGDNALSRRIFGSGEQKTDIADLRKVAQLQKETYDKVFTRVNGKSSIIPPIRNLVQRLPIVGPTVSAVTAKRSVGEIGNGWTYSRPELGEQNDKYFVYRKITEENKVDIPTFNNSSTRTLQQALGVTVSTNPIMNASPSSVLQNVLGMFNSVLPTLPLIGPVGEALRRKNIKYGPLTSTGVYTTYLSILGEKKTPVDTDYKKYITSQYKLIKDGKQKYQAVTEQLGEGKKYSILNNQGVAANELSAQIANYLKNQDSSIKNGDTISYIKYFNGRNGINSLTTKEIQEQKVNAKTKADEIRSRASRAKISYIKDPANNTATKDIYESQNVQVPYKYINGANESFDDPITVSFAMGNDDSVRFRAFIKDLQQSVTPQYNQFQYIGRIEKFINYVSVQRELSFKLGIIAFSESELDNVWRRINYLTGLVFPYGFNRGIHQPNIVRLTIGNVFTGQPGYITSINTSFNELSESWDLDKELPISAQMDIKFIIIEKATKIAESPFYGITEKMDGFSETIDTKETLDTLDPKRAPAVRPIVTSADQRTPTVTSVNQKLPTSLNTTAPRNQTTNSSNTIINTLLGGFAGLGRPTGAGGSTNPFRNSGG